MKCMIVDILRITVVLWSIVERPQWTLVVLYCHAIAVLSTVLQLVGCAVLQPGRLLLFSYGSMQDVVCIIIAHLRCL